MNFAQFGNLAAQLAGLIPSTLQIVQAVETAMPAGTKGADKLAMVKQTLLSAEAIVQTATPIVATVWPVLESLISAAVAAFNASGFFKKSAPPA